MEWTAAILAGGSARRLGGVTKADLMVGGSTVLERQLAALEACGCRPVVIGGRSGGDAARGLTVLPDLDVSGEGPLRGIYTALAATPAARVLVLACDLPFVTAGFLEHLVHADPEAALVVPRTARGLHPLCAVYARGCLPVVAEMLSRGELAVHGLTARVRTHVVPPAVVARFDPDDMLLHNVNTPGDLERAEAFARRHRDARMLPHGRPTVKRP